MTTINQLKVNHTRFAQLGYVNVAPSLWRFCDLTDDQTGYCTVGEQYRTKAELLSDLTRYATEIWGY